MSMMMAAMAANPALMSNFQQALMQMSGPNQQLSPTSMQPQ
jgi:hypothetical protein